MCRRVYFDVVSVRCFLVAFAVLSIRPTVFVPGIHKLLPSASSACPLCRRLVLPGVPQVIVYMLLVHKLAPPCVLLSFATESSVLLIIVFVNLGQNTCRVT